MPSVVAIALAVALTLGPLAAAPVPTLDRPSWTPGDYWTYATNTTILPGLNLTGTVTATVHGRVPLQAGGSSVEGYDVFLAGTGNAAGVVTTANGTYSVTGTWLLTSEERFEPVGLQLVYEVFDLEVNGTANFVFPFSARVQNTTVYQVVSGDWQYPLVAGTSGSLRIAYNFTQDTYSSLLPPLHRAGIGEWNVSFFIGPPVTVATPAGTFQAFPITETWPDGSVGRSFASPQAGNDARTESYAANGNLTAVSTLTAYRYQALEAPTFLGLTASAWTVIGAAGAAAAVGILLARRMRRKKGTPDSRDSPGPDVTSGPRGP